MLRFQGIIILFPVILIIVLLADLFISVPWPVYAGIIIVFTAILAWGSANIRSGFYCRVICNGNMENRSVALTFDDGPDRNLTPEILDILKKENIKAAFFCIGSRIDAEPDIIKRMISEGHIIGGHSYSHHFLFDLFRSERLADEMTRTEASVYRITGRRIKFFRPPYGVTNPPIAKALKKKNYNAIGWSLKSKDTVIGNEAELFRRITRRIRPGDIILFHDNRKITSKVLADIIIFARKNNFTFSPLDKLIGIKAYE